MKLFLFIVFFSFINLYSIDVELGVRGGAINLYSGETNFRKRLDRYDMFNYEVKKGYFPKNLGLHFQVGAFLKYFTPSGKFGLNANYTYFNFSQSHIRRDFLPSTIVIQYLNASLTNADLVTIDDFSIRTSRKDYFLDSVYYFQPKRFGIGLGYRGIEDATNYFNRGYYRQQSVKDTREYKSMGGQVSIYYSLPIQLEGIEGLKLHFRGSYFDLGGKFSESFQQVGVSNAINQQVGIRDYYSYISLGTQIGNPLVHRRGYEFDLLMNFTPHNTSEHLKLFLGFTYQESQLRILNYNRGTASFVNTLGYSVTTEVINSLLVSKFIYSPAYSSPVIDRIYSIYFGASYLFETSSQVTN
ncbi:MAG: hypothetical protein SFU98_05330 [Leptospiraceae bacterium]|nr:hypothetical protein [Leptospiraceae bacterium]